MGTVVAIDTDGQVIAAGKAAIYLGARLVAGAGAPATLKLYHGTDATGPQIASLAAPTALTDEDTTKGGGVSCPNGIFADIGGEGAEALVYVG